MIENYIFNEREIIKHESAENFIEGWIMIIKV